MVDEIDYGRFCVTHKQPDMVDISAKHCEHSLCMTIPYFNVKSEPRGRFCSSHKLARMVDVQTKLCEAAGCTKHPSFGVVGGSRSCSALHRKAGMVYLAGPQSPRL